MPKMNKSNLEQLALMKERIDEYLKKHPTNGGDYKPSFTNFDKTLRDGIVFYSRGWGWRLRKNWQETWQKKYEQEKTLDTTPQKGI